MWRIVRLLIRNVCLMATAICFACGGCCLFLGRRRLSLRHLLRVISAVRKRGLDIFRTFNEVGLRLQVDP